jgi:hypothetical protein
MHVLGRTIALSLGLLLSSVLSPPTANAQTTPEPQAPAQPGYQEPPQQGYPAQNYPQQGSPQPQAYPPAQGYPPAAPPPGYYAPAPGYAQQPGYAQPAPIYAPRAPAVPAFRRGFLAIPFIGFHSVQGDYGKGYDAGLSLGALLGGHINEQISLNGELAFHFMSLKNAPSGYSEAMFDIAFSPLFHIPSGNLEIVMGPKLGGFGYSTSTYYDSYYGGDVAYGAKGVAYGINFGIFGAIGNTALGGMFSYTGRSISSVCATPAGGSENCVDAPSGLDDIQTISITGALLY